MKKALLIKCLIFLSVITVVYGNITYSIVSNDEVRFSDKPIFNLTIMCSTQKGNSTFHFWSYFDTKFVKKYCTKIISVTYDNSTWLEVEEKELDKKTGKLVLTGKTEDASICIEGKKTGRDQDFWNDPNHCYTKTTAWVNGKKVGEVFADENGNWNLEIQLSPGENSIKLEARDPGGNTAEKTLAVEWSPPAQGLLSYYLSKPEVQLGIAVAVLIVLISLGLIIKGERERARREKEIKQKLAQLFEDERILFNRLGDIWKARESPEYHGLIRKILMTGPFSVALENLEKEYLKIRGDSKKVQLWEKKLEGTMKDLLREFDPNLHLYKTAMDGIISTYVYVAKLVIMERVKKLLNKQ